MQVQIEWLLNLVGDIPLDDLKFNNLRPIHPNHLNQLQLEEQILAGEIYTYSIQDRRFLSRRVILLPNILLVIKKEGADHLILSNCTIMKRETSYKEFRVEGLQLSNSFGNTYLYFLEGAILWYKQMKQYCKLSGFLQKYKLSDKMIPGLYSCIRRKDKQNFTVQVHKMDEFEDCPDLLEAVYNEIHILRSIKHHNLLDLKRVYEDEKYLFIVYENYKGESLFQLLNSGVKLHEVQIASIIYQSLQTLKFLHQHQFYHGNITPQTILINTNNQMLQITLVNLTFKEYKVNDTLDWVLSRSAEQFVSPETFLGVAPNIQGDIFSVGAVLYFMTYYDSSFYSLKGEDGDFHQVMDEFEIDPARLESQENSLKENSYKGQESQIRPTTSSSLDLMKKLMVINPSIISRNQDQRLGLQEATKHHWFVNVKSKIKTLKVDRKRKKALPSLRTIIELREQSEMDLRMSNLKVEANVSRTGPSMLSCLDIDHDEFDDKQSLQQQLSEINSYTKQPSKRFHQIRKIQKPIDII